MNPSGQNGSLATSEVSSHTNTLGMDMRAHPHTGDREGLE